MAIQKRLSSERGSFKNSWLSARYTFSFSRYYNPKYLGFSDLLVINDDRISGGTGFETHTHDNMEIFTYVIEGAMAHKDSISGKETIIKSGEFQYMAAGTGVSHSEKCATMAQTRIMQMWVKPDVLNATPAYNLLTRQQINTLSQTPLILLSSGSGKDGSIKMNSKQTKVFLLKFKENEQFEFILKDNRCYYFQVAQGAASINGDAYLEGDGGAINSQTNLQKLSFKTQNEAAEIILFQLREA